MTADDSDARWATTVINDTGVALLRYIARRTNREDVEDVLNDSLTVVWERRASIPRDRVEARMWAFGVTRNTLKKHGRNRSMQNRLTDALRSVARLVPDATQTIDPAEALEGEERHADVRAALSMLRASDRELITLVHWDDFTLIDAAALLGINPSTARTRYARAKGRLAAQLAHHRVRPLPLQRPVVPNTQAQP